MAPQSHGTGMGQEWATARTVADLAALTARWLEGDLASQPGWEPGYGPDDETAELVPVLALLNRAGVLTRCSQPGGVSSDGDQSAVPEWEQRATVDGYASPDLAHRLARAATAAGLMAVIHPIECRWWVRGDRYAGLEMSREDGIGVTWGGRQPHRREVVGAFGQCHHDAVAALLCSVYLTVMDPVWRRNTVLWPVLLEAIAGEPVSASGHCVTSPAASRNGGVW